MIHYQYFPKTKKMPEHLNDIISVFTGIADDIDSTQHHWKSNEVLKKVSPGLKSLSFVTEPADSTIKVPVLFGRNNSIEKFFAADAFNAETHTVLEVEAGRAYTNNQFLKDLFQACMMHDTRFLAIAVRNEYNGNKDFEKIFQFFDTLYQSDRLQLPLEGVLLIGY